MITDTKTPTHTHAYINNFKWYIIVCRYFHDISIPWKNINCFRPQEAFSIHFWPPRGKTALRCPSASCMCEMAVASAISSSTGSTEVAMDVAGCRSMKMIYGHMALPKSVHQESSGLSSCSIQPPKMVLVVSHILTQTDTPIGWIILMSLASETMIIMEFTMQLDSCTYLLKQAFKSQMFCP